MFLVQNTTRRTIMLSDINVELGPRRVLDLEKVKSRSDLDSSRDLATALKNKQLAIFRRTIIKNKEGVPTTRLVPDTSSIEKIIRNNTIDENRMKDLIREVVLENKTDPVIEIKTEKEIVKETDTVMDPSIQESLNKLMNAVEKIQNNPQQVIVKETSKPEEFYQDIPIDPQQLANLQEKPIKKLQDELQGSSGKKSRKIKISNSRSLSDLADELEE